MMNMGNMSWKKLLWAMAIWIIVWFVLATLIWALWNATIPRLLESLAGGPPVAFSNLSFPSGLLLGLLVVFLAAPISGTHKFVTNYNFWDVSYTETPVVEVVEMDDM